MFYYSISNYTAARALTEEIVQRTSPPAPWWALNRYGMCQLALGLSESALAAFECALPVVPTREDEGTTLVNLSQIYHVRGDYDRALGYLEQSLAICREIGDKAGEGTALHNLSQIYYEQSPQSTRRNALPVKLIDGSLVMGHQYLACALV
jgi:tetratricopeptide (TPR) repeat protein